MNEKRKERQRIYYLAHREQERNRARVYRLAHQEERKDYDKAYCLAHKEKIRDKKKAYRLTHNRLARYGLTQASFDHLLMAQGGVCAICGRSDWNGSGPRVDHDHNTGKVRAILCNNCNLALGLLHDDLNIIKKMGDYISKFKEMTA